nr:LEAF RUST 10 DISEASE-RESISTANCE LOCUS RECEPTOR-LIKE PROTEIN KINASE-like 1.1 [Ipomoea trifida]
MAQPFNPACFFFSFLLPLMAAFYSVHGEAEFLSNCTKEFSCGAIGFVDFPFAKHTEPHCGLVPVKCNTTPPIVQLGTGGDWYPLLSVMKPPWGDYTYKINLEDSKLQRPFESRNYSKLNYTLHFQNSPSITFLNSDASIFNNHFKCNDTQAGICNYERYNCTEGYSLYYKLHLPENPKCGTVNCTLYPTPIIIQQTNDGLTAQFGLSLQVSKTCQECYNGGGQCTEDSENVFHCAQVSGSLALLILLSFAIFVAWRSKKGSKGYSRYKSSDPASDLEIGRSRLFGILVFSYSELEEATSKFDHSKELGDGAFGTVYYKEIGAMAQPFNPACFFSFLLPLMAAFYFVHGEAKFLSNCTKEFSCGAIGFVEFPFAKHTEPHCGLVAVKCDTTPPIVQLGTGGDWYPLLLVKSFGSDYTIAIGDPKLQRPFESRNYSNLNYTIHFQNSPSITFLNLDASILNNFFKCNDTQGGIRNYERYNCTGVFTLYYKLRLPENPKCHAVNCTLYPSPIIIQQTNGGLTAQFVLSLGVSKTCQDCYQGGGQCTEDSENVFHCAQVSGSLALLVLLSFAIFVAWRSKKGSKGYSRYKSSGSASDLEIGRSRLFGILVFSYSELEEATSKFDPSKELGDGAFGTVYYGGATKSNAMDMGWSFFTCRWCDYEACCSYQEQFLKSLELAIAFLLYGIWMLFHDFATGKAICMRPQFLPLSAFNI